MKNKAKYLIIIKQNIPEYIMRSLEKKLKEKRDDVLIICGDDIEFHKLDVK